MAQGNTDIEAVTDPFSVRKVAKFQPAYPPPRAWQRRRRWS